MDTDARLVELQKALTAAIIENESLQGERLVLQNRVRLAEDERDVLRETLEARCAHLEQEVASLDLQLELAQALKPTVRPSALVTPGAFIP